MSRLSEYRALLKAARSRIGYWKSLSLIQYTVSLTRIMKSERVSGKALAKRLGISPQQVSKVLRGDENVTVETMARFADALDATVHIHVAKKGVAVCWDEIDIVRWGDIDSAELPTYAGMIDDSPIVIESITYPSTNLLTVN